MTQAEEKGFWRRHPEIPEVGEWLKKFAPARIDGLTDWEIESMKQTERHPAYFGGVILSDLEKWCEHVEQFYDPDLRDLLREYNAFYSSHDNGHWMQPLRTVCSHYEIKLPELRKVNLQARLLRMRQQHPLLFTTLGGVQSYSATSTVLRQHLIDAMNAEYLIRSSFHCIPII